MTFVWASSNWIHYSVCQWTVCQCKGRSVCARNVLRMICRWMLLSLLNVVSMKCYPLALSTIHMQYSHHLSLFISFLFYFSLSPLRIQSHSIAFTLTQIIRDLGFMIPDLFHFIIPIWLLRKTRRENYSTKPFYRDHKLKYDTLATFFIVTILLLICSFL